MISVTGGAGYIGSHTCVELIEAGYDLIIYDNFSNSSDEAIKRVEKIVCKSILLEEGDIRDKNRLSEVFKKMLLKIRLHYLLKKI